MGWIPNRARNRRGRSSLPSGRQPRSRLKGASGARRRHSRAGPLVWAIGSFLGGAIPLLVLVALGQPWRIESRSPAGAIPAGLLRAAKPQSPPGDLAQLTAAPAALAEELEPAPPPPAPRPALGSQQSLVADVEQFACFQEAPASAPAPAATVVSMHGPRRPVTAPTSARELLHSALLQLPVTKESLERLRTGPDGLLFERFGEALQLPAGSAPVQVEYSLDRELSERVFELFDRYHVDLGHAIVADARSGRLLVYASTDTERFPPTRRYPAASLVKVVTASAAMRHAPKALERDCRYRGSPYTLTRALLTPPVRGNTASFRRALATSNNQCFAQLAVHALGPRRLLEQITAFGWLNRPALGHEQGSVAKAGDAYDLGRLGSGLAGTEITPLHAAQMAMLLASGTVQQPYWIERVSAAERDIPVPEREPGRVVLSNAEVRRLRELLVETTRSGTAQRAFRRRGRPLLHPVSVAGKTGSLSGRDPDGRYEWFVGVAPADNPQIAIAVLTVQGKLWYATSSQLAAEILRQVFCPKGVCSASAAQRWVKRGSQALVAGSE
jgi:hypothetical protein